jgi:hypothetical protein
VQRQQVHAARVQCVALHARQRRQLEQSRELLVERRVGKLVEQRAQPRHRRRVALLRRLLGPHPLHLLRAAEPFDDVVHRREEQRVVAERRAFGVVLVERGAEAAEGEVARAVAQHRRLVVQLVGPEHERDGDVVEEMRQRRLAREHVVERAKREEHLHERSHVVERAVRAAAIDAEPFGQVHEARAAREQLSRERQGVVRARERLAGEPLDDREVEVMTVVRDEHVAAAELAHARPQLGERRRVGDVGGGDAVHVLRRGIDRTIGTHELPELVDDDAVAHAHRGDLHHLGALGDVRRRLDVDDGEIAERRARAAAREQLQRLEQREGQTEHRRVVGENRLGVGGRKRVQRDVAVPARRSRPASGISAPRRGSIQIVRRASRAAASRRARLATSAWSAGSLSSS